jgi:hypothetical protein
MSIAQDDQLNKRTAQSFPARSPYNDDIKNITVMTNPAST